MKVKLALVFTLFSFNRTNVELKLRGDSNIGYAELSFNRTIVELKLAPKLHRKTFNQTMTKEHVRAVFASLDGSRRWHSTMN